MKIIINGLLFILIFSQLSCTVMQGSSMVKLHLDADNDSTYVALEPDTNYVKMPSYINIPGNLSTLTFHVKNPVTDYNVNVYTYKFNNFPRQITFLTDGTVQVNNARNNALTTNSYTYNSGDSTNMQLKSSSFVANQIQLKSDANFISIAPLVLINHGIKVEFEHQFNTNHYFVVGCEFNYLFQDPGTNYFYNEFDAIQEYVGAGIDLGHKRFFIASHETIRPYFHYSLTYHYGNFKTPIADYEERDEYGNTIYFPVKKMLTDQTHKIGFNTILGFRFRLFDNIYSDIYAGVGMRYSIRLSQQTETPKYNDYIWHPGYSGPLPLGGITLGIYF